MSVSIAAYLRYRPEAGGVPVAIISAVIVPEREPGE